MFQRPCVGYSSKRRLTPQGDFNLVIHWAELCSQTKKWNQKWKAGEISWVWQRTVIKPTRQMYITAAGPWGERDPCHNGEQKTVQKLYIHTVLEPKTEDKHTTENNVQCQDGAINLSGRMYVRNVHLGWSQSHSDGCWAPGHGRQSSGRRRSNTLQHRQKGTGSIHQPLFMWFLTVYNPLSGFKRYQLTGGGGGANIEEML